MWNGNQRMKEAVIYGLQAQVMTENLNVSFLSNIWHNEKWKYQLDNRTEDG